ncbi:MAG: electron transport complex subunit RsxB [Comamonadaceae bacterium]|nr:MAG: electron transport complex subunit RsxB [Comamonadaceae bacterium]
MTPLAERLNALLPQTQCTRCGFPDCAAYAEAIAANDTPINQCPPGGAEGIARLAALTGRPVLPLNPDHGDEGPRALAVIDEAWCIGCTLCLDACPTDAILGGNKMMHTVIEPWCTGCEMCIPVCPVDCISLENVTGDRTGWAAWSQADAATARRRYTFHQARRDKTPPGSLQNALQHRDIGVTTPAETSSAAAPAKQPAIPQTPEAEAADRKRAVIKAALEKARSRANTPHS